MGKKPLSAEPKKKIEVDEEIDLDEEDRTAVDLMVKENLIELDQHIEKKSLSEREKIMVTNQHMEKENHDEINQRFEKESLSEINQDDLISHELIQQDRVDQAPLLVDQDQIGRISTPQFHVEAHCMRLRS